MNKTTTSIAIVLITLASSSSAQTDLYSTVTNLWWEGPKTNILAIAEERLARRFPDERTAGRSVMSFPFGSRAPPRRRRGGSSCNSVTISGKIRENARKTCSSVPDCKTIVKSSPAPLFSPPRSATAACVRGNEHDLSTFRSIPSSFPVELGPELGPYKRSLVPFQRNLVPKSNSMYRILILFPQKRPPPPFLTHP